MDSYRPSMDDVSSAGHSQSSASHLFVGNRGRSASDVGPRPSGSGPSRPALHFLGGQSLSVTSTMSGVLPSEEVLSTPPRSGHRSSASTPNALAPPPPAATRSRSSTLRSLFVRNGSNLSLSPGAGGPTGRSPYGQTGASGSNIRLANASSTSVSSMSIGAPIAHSAGTCKRVVASTPLTADADVSLASQSPPHSSSPRMGPPRNRSRSSARARTSELTVTARVPSPLLYSTTLSLPDGWTTPSPRQSLGSSPPPP